jgi:hemolysin III
MDTMDPERTAMADAGVGPDTDGPHTLVDVLEDAYGLRPSWRGWLHAAAFVIVLPAGLYLLSGAQTTGARIAVAVYWASLAGLFGTSASYHRIARTPRAVLWFRRADHSMIFLLIAGTYTPLCLVALPAVWGIPMLVTAWVTALAGVIMKMVRLGAGPGSSGSWLYIVLGWGAVVTLPALVSSLDAGQLVLLGTGGLLYTVGAVVLARRRPDPVPHRFGYHEVWHAMTLVAGACHFVLIASIV